MTIDKNDPRLIDYALGELGDEERTKVDAELASSEAAREELNEIARAASVARESISETSATTLSDEQRAAIIHSPAPKFNRLPVWQSFVRGLAAAALIIVVGAVMLPAFAPVREAARRSSPENDAKQAALMAAIEANEQTGAAQRSPEMSDHVSANDGLENRTVTRQAVRSPQASPLDPEEISRIISPEQREAALRREALNYQVAVAGRPDLQSLGYLEGDGTGAQGGPQSVTVGGNVKIRGNWYSTSDLQAAAPDAYRTAPQRLPQTSPSNTETYDSVTDNAFKRVTDEPLSTFSIDVDTAAYANVRRFLNQGQLPPKDAVRIEEMINYFDYAYEPPTGEHPFAVHVEVAACPWKPGHQLARIGLQGKVLDEGEQPPTNLVFLIDVSGSMNQPNKLPLLVESMKLVVDRMRPQDTVALTVYAGSSGLVLPPTSGVFKDAIRGALDNLRAGGSTNGGAGIQLAYQTATQAFIDGGVNRVILATDGDFNVGTTNRGDLVRMIEEKAKSGVFLSVLGFGMGNLKDATMEELSGKGNGNYAYIDTLREARKVLVEQAAGTLVTIAKDVKIQVDFNPANVQAYRLIGYENRMLAAQDFEDDTKDAGEIGAGHSVTALYEIVPAGVPFDVPGKVSPSVYQTPSKVEGNAGELMQVRLRYKLPESDTSVPLVVPVPVSDSQLESASSDFRFASAVAAFGMLLRGSPYSGTATYGAVLSHAQAGLGVDAQGYRAEFVSLVRQAEGLRSVEARAAEEALRAAERAYRDAQERVNRVQQR